MTDTDSSPDARSGRLLAGLGLVVGLLAAGALGYGVGRIAGKRAEASPTASSPVLARVGERTLTAEQFRLRWERLLTDEARAFHRSRGGPENFLDEVVEELLLAAEAERRGLVEPAEVAEALRRDRHRALAAPLLLQEVRGQAIPEAELRRRFEQVKDRWQRATRVRIREIVATAAPEPAGLRLQDDATTLEEARAKLERLRERILAGEDFASLAEQHSEAPSARYGGLIGWVQEGRFAESYEAAAMGLQAGEVSEVVERGGTSPGLAILKAEEREDARPAEFAEHRADVLAEVLEEDPGALQRRYRVFVEQLRREQPPAIDREAVDRALADLP